MSGAVGALETVARKYFVEGKAPTNWTQQDAIDITVAALSTATGSKIGKSGARSFVNKVLKPGADVVELAQEFFETRIGGPATGFLNAFINYLRSKINNLPSESNKDKVSTTPSSPKDDTPC